jgi:hypothetical protein
VSSVLIIGLVIAALLVAGAFYLSDREDPKE